MKDICILAVNINNYTVYDFLDNNETKEELLARANSYKENTLTRYKEIINNYKKGLPKNSERLTYFAGYLEKVKKDEYRIMNWNQFKEEKKKYLLNNALEEITQDKWQEILNILPPYKHCTINGVEMFCTPKMHSETFTIQYARYDGKYYKKMVNCMDKTTWIHNFLN